MAKFKQKIKFSTKFEGEQELKTIIESMTKIPKVALNRSVKPVAKQMVIKMNNSAPNGQWAKGNLSKSFTTIMEKTKKTKNQAGFQVVIDRKYNSIFQRQSNQQKALSASFGDDEEGLKKELKARGMSKHYYYPSSLEYGYDHYYWGRDYKNKRPVGGHKEGRKFVRKTLERNANFIRVNVSKRLLDELRKRWEGKK